MTAYSYNNIGGSVAVKHAWFYYTKGTELSRTE